MTNGPIIIVEDDLEEQDVIKACINDAGFKNELRLFRNGRQVLDYLYATPEQPFIILADIQMPVVNGLELLKTINTDPYLHEKAIPFIFFTIAASGYLVKEAYALFTQGFFVKANHYAGRQMQVSCILTYWKHSKHPNNTP